MSVHIWVDPETIEVRFRLEDKVHTLCRVTREAIDDHCGSPRSKNHRIEAAQKNLSQIMTLVEWKISTRAFEPDGTVLVRSKDWRSV